MLKLQTSKPEVGKNPQIIMFSSGARFPKAPETFRARKAIFNSSASKNGEVNTPESSSMKETSDHMRIKQLCNRKIRDFGFTGPKGFQGFRETSPCCELAEKGKIISFYSLLSLLCPGP